MKLTLVLTLMRFVLYLKVYNRFHNEENAVLIITHHNQILQKLKPDYVHVLINGKIVKTGDASLGS